MPNPKLPDSNPDANPDPHPYSNPNPNPNPTPNQVGLMFSLMCAGYMLGALPIGALTYRWNPT